MSSLPALIVAYGWMLPREANMVNRSAGEVKCKSAFSSPESWIPRYIRTLKKITWELTQSKKITWELTQSKKITWELTQSKKITWELTQSKKITWELTQ